jgi:hypothetical protein
MFIAGDLFDYILDTTSHEFTIIIGFLNRLLDYCHDNDIQLRVLYGTPGHDFGQTKILVKLNEGRVNKADLVYHEKLDIEYLPRLGKHVLYIPDEWTHDHDDLERQIAEKLAEHSIHKVDIGIFHGQFEYQFAGKPYKGFFYKEAYFTKLVTGLIHVGHYHNYNPKGRIIPNGSLERLGHGDEIAKGYIRVKDGVPIFMENTNAYIYKTINVTPATNLEKLNKIISKYPKGSHIRLHMDEDHPFNLTFGEIKLMFMDYIFKKKLKNDASEQQSVTYILNDDSLDSGDGFALSTNFHEELLKIIDVKYDLNSIERTKLDAYISIFKDATEVEALAA